MRTDRFVVAYSRALKFAAEGESMPWTDHQEAERKGFENAIQSNPLEAQNHLAYSDWLHEHGEHDEGDFRKAMGELLGQHNPNPELNPKPRSRETSTLRVKLPWIVPHDILDSLKMRPTDDTRWKVLTGGENRDSIFHAGGKGYLPLDPTNWAFDYHKGQPAMRWGTYHNMESALRQAFMANRKRGS